MLYFRNNIYFEGTSQYNVRANGNRSKYPFLLYIGWDLEATDGWTVVQNDYASALYKSLSKFNE